MVIGPTATIGPTAIMAVIAPASASGSVSNAAAGGSSLLA
jgi:hypothetical protein